ncbi:toprim domain-containing protein [Photorhabdus tasmaniensis]
MAYASPAVNRTPHEVSDHFIKLVHARIAEVAGWRYVFERIPAFKEACEKAPRQVPCPFTGNGKSKFRFRKKDLYTGCAIHNDYAVNAFCDGIDVLAEHYKLTKTQTCKKILTDFFGMDLYAPLTDADILSERRYKTAVRATETLDSEEVEKRLRKLEVLYHYTGEIKPNSPVAMYLRKRGFKRILNHLPKDLGLNNRLYYWNQEKQKASTYPGMIAIYRDTRGRPLTIHRTFVEKDGDKANVDNPKLMMKPPADMTGGSIQLFDPHYDSVSCTWTLGVAEGIENALSVTEATSTPCWAASSAWCLENVVVPDYLLPPSDAKVINFYIWADKDIANTKGNCAGMASAKRLQNRMEDFFAKRYLASELIVRVFEPACDIPKGKKGVDWNDVLKATGSDGFPIKWAPEFLDQL